MFQFIYPEVGLLQTDAYLRALEERQGLYIEIKCESDFHMAVII